MKRWNIIQLWSQAKGTYCMRVKGGSTHFFPPVTGTEPLSATLGVIVQSTTVKHPEEWPCRQMGATQLDLQRMTSETRIQHLKDALADTLKWSD